MSTNNPTQELLLRIAGLNPSAGEIGAGMLANIISEARRLHILNVEVAILPDGDAVRAMESMHKQCEGFYEAVKMGEA